MCVVVYITTIQCGVDFISRYKDISGQKFGRLTALFPIAGIRPIKWHCMCECGNEVDVSGCSLRNGTTKSCGCYKRELHKTHGLTDTKLHGVWRGMLQRCYYQKHVDNKWYLSKSLEVCDEWRYDFASFYDWSIKNGYRDGLSIDRIDNSLGYSPENCRWSTPQEQANNRSTNINITYQGRTQTLKQWATELGIKYGTLYYRTTHGKSFGEAIKK